jgi:hypothetical protein
MYVTGGCGALYDGASPDGSRNQRAITRVHQAFGRNYQLPNTTAHNETCASIGNVLWNWRMFLASAEAKYVDVLELALYNSVLSGVGLGGTDYFYTNPLRQHDTLPVELRWSRTRVPFMTCFCCPPNVVRTIARANGYAYGKSDRAVWVNLYGSSTLDTTVRGAGRIRLEQKTNYPWDGDIRITVVKCDSAAIGLKLRIPGWAESARLEIDGSPAEVATMPGTYATIWRTWKPGTTIDLRIPMPPRLLESHPLVEETRNHVAIKRGPVVYCLESNDLPPGTSLADIRIPSDIELEPRFDAELLRGVTKLNGTVVSRPAGDWKGKLYREFKRSDAAEVSTTFIPYYAWSNRGRSEMTVWLPLDH